MLALLGVVALHYAYAAERLGQAARHLSVDLGALPEDGADGAEGLAQSESKDGEKAEGNGAIPRLAITSIARIETLPASLTPTLAGYRLPWR